VAPSSKLKISNFKVYKRAALKKGEKVIEAPPAPIFFLKTC
jgi:hypothetical protein